jgi:hypothetical protein
VPPGAIISHVTVVEPPTYPKLIIAGDVAIIPQPDFNQKVAITKYLVHAAHSLGIEMPKVAVIAATEKVNAKMPACTDAALLTKMAERGQIPGCIIDGPLAIDLAIDPDSVAIKGVSTPIAGQADCLVFPNIESGKCSIKPCPRRQGGAGRPRGGHHQARGAVVPRGQRDDQAVFPRAGRAVPLRIAHGTPFATLDSLVSLWRRWVLRAPGRGRRADSHTLGAVFMAGGQAL